MIIGWGSVSAQPYTSVPSNVGQSWTSYYYLYDGINYMYNYGYYMWYDYLTPNYQEWILTADDMKKAGLCAGPLDAMSLRFIYNNVTLQGRVRIFVRPIPSTQYTLGFHSTNQYSYPSYYLWAATGFGSNVVPGTNSTEVYDNPNFKLPIIARGDSTWLDFEFNKATVVWDGSSSLVFGFLRCNDTYSYQYDVGMLWEATNPPAGLGYFYTYYFPSNGAYYYNNYYTCAQGPYYYNQNYMYQYNYQTYQYKYQEIRPMMRVRISAGVSQSFPDDVDPRRILRAGSNYNGSSAAFPKPSLTFYQQAGKAYTITYKIVGPLPSTSVVYTATLAGNPNVTYVGNANGYTTYPFSQATGIYAGTNGALDLTFANGGSYRVESTFASDCGTQTWRKAFIIAFPNDVATVAIRSPQALPKKNPLNVTMPLSSQIQNVGLNNVTDVDIRAIIRTYPGGQVLYDQEVNWLGNLATGDRASVDVNQIPFIPTAVGQYTAEFCATLNSAIDQQANNDCLPSAGQMHLFQVNYNEEAGAGAIVVPATTGRYFANRPMRPQGEINNNGILDLSDIPVRMEIFQMPGRTRVYNERIIVQSVDATAPNNIAAANFPLFTPQAAGQYEACMTVEYPGDPDNTNDQVCQTFSVDANLAGVYTIGLKNQGKPKNFPTFELAANELFEKGVSGP
ncbi:MAG: hypothetical protein EHM43_10280, partial [Ignavibacteriae bacterium]